MLDLECCGIEKFIKLFVTITSNNVKEVNISIS